MERIVECFVSGAVDGLRQACQTDERMDAAMYLLQCAQAAGGDDAMRVLANLFQWMGEGRAANAAEEARVLRQLLHRCDDFDTARYSRALRTLWTPPPPPPPPATLPREGPLIPATHMTVVHKTAADAVQSLSEAGYPVVFVSHGMPGVTHALATPEW